MMDKKLRKNILKIVIFLIIPLVLIVYFVLRHDNIELSVLELSTEEMQTVREIDIEALEGFQFFSMMRQLRGVDYELFVTNEQQQGSVVFFDDDLNWIETYDSLVLDTPQDTIYVIFENVLNEAEEFEDVPIRDTFMLKVFYNYAEVSFRPLNQETFNTEFLFSLSEGYQVHIPIQLSEVLEEDDYLNNLTIAIFGTPEHHTIDREGNFWQENELNDSYSLSDWGNGIVRNITITYGGTQTPVLHGIHHEVKIFENAEDQILHIDNEFDEFHEYAISTIPSSPMRVSTSEEIELMFSSALGSFESTEVDNYLVIALMDWNQVEISGLPYLLVDVSETAMRYETRQGRFSITAPDEPGFYDFVAFVIANPVSPNTNELNRNIPHLLSFRFTIEVQAE